jgi:hypothetical protein
MAVERDPVMAKIEREFVKSKLTLDQLGTKMGYPVESARKSAWQFVYTTNDPRLSMLRKFATAVGTTLKNLV